MKTVFKLMEVENAHSITKLSDSDFLFLLQHSALLGLKETGAINEMQYRQAEEMLRRQRRETVRINHEETVAND